jgi:hypothetical protein
MSEINPINLDELKTTVEPPKKKRGRPRKVKATESTDVVASVESEEAEIKRLREQLMNYADHNPDIVEKPINNRIGKLVNSMDLDELRARCRQGKKINASRMDSVVGRQVITLANVAVGQILDCLDELNESTKNDPLLQECATEYLSLHLLDFVPEELKIAGIYSSHVLTAYQDSLNRKPSLIQQIKKKIAPVEEEKKVEEQPDLPPAVEIKSGSVEAFIPKIEEVRDKLIRFKAELEQEE